MKTLAKWSAGLAAGAALLLVVAFAIDRLLLAPSCPPCHADETRRLPAFAQGRPDGLVRIRPGEFEFRARIAGFADNPGGDGVILLHGYPETSIMWKALIAPLTKAGYRVVAYDQRGYSPGARPGSVAAYAQANIVNDVIAVAEAVGFTRFHLVGHDWGGIVAWSTAGRYPDRVATLSILSMPHPGAFAESLSANEDQLRRSSYAVLNWVPWVSELVIGFNRAAWLRHFSWRDKTPEQRTEYIHVFSEPGAVAAALKWYRAYSSIDAAEEIGGTRQPTLYIWGNRDQRLGRVAAEKTADFVKGPFRLIKLAASHALMVDVPDEVAAEVLTHLAQWPLSRLPPPAPELPLLVNVPSERCLPSKPACLRINVAPAGDYLYMENRCEEGYQGTIRLRCPEIDKGVLDFRFKLAPGSELHQTVQGRPRGDCYYNQRICLAK